MQKFTQKWAIISLLDDATEGDEFYYTDFPLHVTLAGVFASDKNGKQLADELKELLDNQPPVSITASETALFGPEKDVKVMKIEKTPALMELYERIHSWLVDSDTVYNSPEYQGKGYLPHSTFQKSSSLAPGEKRLLESVSFIDLYPGNDGYQRKIFKTIKLG